MTRALLLAVAAGVLSTLPLIAALTSPGGLVLALLTPLPLFLVGLSQGAMGAAIAGATAIVLVALLDGLLAGLTTAVILALPVLVLVRQALLNRPAADGSVEWYPPGHLVMWLTGIGVAWLAITIVLLASTGQGIETTVRGDVQQALSLVLPDLSAEDLSTMSSMTTAFALGAGPVSWLLLLTGNAVLAQGALLRFGHAFRPAPDITQLELPRWLVLAVAASLLVAVFGSGDLAYIAQNLTIVLALPFFFAGLAVVHLLLRRAKSTLLLVVFYLAMALFAAWLVAPVLALGIVDQAVGLRRRMSGGSKDQEEE